MAAWLGVVPALLAALAAGWCGNLLGGVTAAGSTTTLLSLLLATAAFAGPWRDPLRLGNRWWLAPLGLWIGAAASAWLSPVPRAGLEPVVLLPAFLCLPGAFARCWRGEAARRLGLRAMAGTVALLAAWALLAGLRGGETAAGAAAALAAAPPTAAPGFAATLAPLGHHTLLATWLATLLPLALLPWREQTAWRWLGAGAGILGVAAVAAGGSLAGGAALACEALAAAALLSGNRGGRGAGPMAAARPDAATAAATAADIDAAIERPAVRRGRRWPVAALALAALALAAFLMPRAVRIAGRQDPSALARAVYFEAGWQGWRERPWLGWGPGSVPWTAAWFLAPRPGVIPWGEGVGELHSLPVHLAYETGALGLLAVLATAGAFAARRVSERRGAADRGLLVAGCLGLAGAGIAWLGTAALAVAALPIALAVAAGAALAGGAAAPSPAAAAPPASGPPLVPPPPRPSAAACLYALAAAAAMVAPEAARWQYDRAVAASQAGRRAAAVAELAAAVRLDPELPLYRMRLALLEAGTASAPGAPALAWRAAREARGVGLLWLAAGILGREGGEVWAPAALEQSCALDPLSPFPPFYLMASSPDAAAAPRLGARALLAEPRLAAATFWEGREPLFRRTLEEIDRWPGINAGWKLALLRAAPAPWSRRGPIVRQELTIDADGFTRATSLHLFRRLPWPARWQLPRLRENLVGVLDLPPATALRDTDGKPFSTRRCGS